MDEQQLVTSVAVAVATKAMEGLAEGGKAAMGALTRLIRSRLGGEAHQLVALEAASGATVAESDVHALRESLREAMAGDPDFAAEVRRLWQTVSSQQLTTDNAVSNGITGTVSGNAVQARDVQGGISFGAPHPQSR